jgi:hypothetical protein
MRPDSFARPAKHAWKPLPHPPPGRIAGNEPMTALSAIYDVAASSVVPLCPVVVNAAPGGNGKPSAIFTPNQQAICSLSRCMLPSSALRSNERDRKKAAETIFLPFLLP